jgi:NAD-dependent deacetylase
LHGCLYRVRCDCDNAVRENWDVPIHPRTCACGQYWRPDVVWFEDPLDPEVLSRAQAALETCDLLVSVGTSGVVYPAADLPRVAMKNGAVTVEVNPEDTPVSRLYAHTVRAPAAEALPAMWEPA